MLKTIEKSNAVKDQAIEYWMIRIMKGENRILWERIRRVVGVSFGHLHQGKPPWRGIL